MTEVGEGEPPTRLERLQAFWCPRAAPAVVTAVFVASGCHIFVGVLSVVVGVISTIKAEVWLAHRVSPIWSGGFFIITGIIGIFCAKRKTSYIIMCFTAFSMVSLVTGIVSIQLLRMGLVNHTTDGQTYAKENKDVLIFISLGAAGAEGLVCLVSTVLSCRIAKVAKEMMSKEREGMFHVKVLGQKDILVVTKPPQHDRPPSAEHATASV